MRNLYISQLDSRIQNLIKDKLIKFYKEELDEVDIETELELAMNSRLSNLEDTINIDKIIKLIPKKY